MRRQRLIGGAVALAILAAGAASAINIQTAPDNQPCVPG